MSTIIADMAMSLDGYIADPEDRIDRLIGWYFSGDVEVPTANPDVSFRPPKASAEVITGAVRSVGAIIGGRRYFDLAEGWGGTHPMGVPVFILSHRPPPDGWPEDGPIKFVSDGLESAVEQARAAAGDKAIAIATPSVIWQCAEAGLLDSININLVPVVLGEGIQFAGSLEGGPVELEDPDVVPSTGVTHLTYRVRKRARS